MAADEWIRNVGMSRPALVISQEPGAAAQGNPALAINQADPNGPGVLIKSAGPLIDLQTPAGTSRLKVNASGDVTGGGTLAASIFPATLAQLGLISWNYNSLLAQAASGTPVSGTGYLMKIPLFGAPVSVTNILAGVQTAGSSLTASQCFAGLYDNTGAKIGVTADQSVAWTSTGLKTMALAGGPFAGSWPWVYVAIITNGTTNPQFTRAAGAVLGTAIVNFNAVTSDIPFATSGSGLTALPASFAYSSNVTTNAQAIWVALS